MVVMLDGSTSAYHMVPYLAKYKNLIVITSGAKTALMLAEANIRTFCTGGQMIIHSYSYVGEQAEEFIKNFNADILFFSSQSLSLDGDITDSSEEETAIRKVMLKQAKKKVFLCDSSKFGQGCFNNLCHISDVDEVICDEELPEYIMRMRKTQK
jgi:DeoR/GlpR family transcriptional regulator of sugar metabolism